MIPFWFDLDSSKGNATHNRRNRNATNKDYVCDYGDCGKTFYQKRNLVRHQRITHNSAMENFLYQEHSEQLFENIL